MDTVAMVEQAQYVREGEVGMSETIEDHVDLSLVNRAAASLEQYAKGASDKDKPKLLFSAFVAFARACRVNEMPKSVFLEMAGMAYDFVGLIKWAKKEDVQ